MGWKDILFILALFCVTAFILYRAVKKKKWCPDIYGSDSCGVNDKQKKSQKKQSFPDP